MSTENGAYVFIYLTGQGFVPCGVVQVIEEGDSVLRCRFQYEDSYLDRADVPALDPQALPLSIGDRITDPPAGFPMHPVFLDHIPDAWGQRILGAIAAEQGMPLDYFDLLVSGSYNRIGALAFGDNAEGPRWDYPLQPVFEQAFQIDLQGVMEAVEEFQAKGYHELSTICREYLATGSSVGGARPKALCVLDGKPVIAKFKAADDTFNVCRVEHAALRLAESLGMRVSTSRRIEVAGRDVFISERFDRMGEDRVHQVSAATMIQAAPDWRPIGSFSYQDLARVASFYSAPDRVQPDREELFRRMVYNMLTANEDDHLRNHCFLYQGEGWRLSPLYDVVPGFHAPRHLYLSAGKQGSLMSLSNSLSDCAVFGLSRGRALSIVEEMTRVFYAAWRDVFNDCGVPDADMSQLQNIFAAHRLLERETDQDVIRLLEELR